MGDLSSFYHQMAINGWFKSIFPSKRMV
jgi:hypothetical protein